MEFEQQTIENASWISLSEDEKVELWSHPSIYPYIPVYLVSILLILAGLILPFMMDSYGNLTLLLIPVGIITLILEYIRYITVFYVFTNKRVVRKKGILRHKTRSVSYGSMDKVKTDQPLIGRILKYGDMTIVTATPSEKDIYMKFIPKLEKANEIVSKYKVN